MPETHSNSFLVFPTTNRCFTWQVRAVESNRTISRHKNLGLAIRKAEKLNVLASMPEPQFATRDDHQWMFLRGHCQQEVVRPGEPGYTDPCNAPATITDSVTSLGFCADCWREGL